MITIPEETLTKAAGGDIEAFEAIYRETAALVYNVAIRMVHNREDAEEIAQEVFMVVHRKLKSFRFESSLATWIYRITVNCSINFIKKRIRTEEKVMKYQEDARLEERREDRLAETAEREGIIRKMLGLLNPDQRACVILKDIEGLSYTEIASTLQININTVRSRLARARERLMALKKAYSATTVNHDEAS